jgi:glycosidase
VNPDKRDDSEKPGASLPLDPSAQRPRPPEAGSWLGKSVIYHVLIDRFSCSQAEREAAARAREHLPVFCGGDLQGLARRIPYLQQLGVTALWVSPFTQGPASPKAYHGYHPTDLRKVESRFGGEEGLAELVSAAKSSGIKVIMDFVANHVHRDHPFFRQALADRKSPYRDWFCWESRERYLSFLHFRELPKLNLEHPEARRYIIDAAWHWLQRGVDGLRCDHALGPSIGFWSEFQAALKARSPDVILIGEVAFAGIRRDHLPTLNLPNKETYFLAQQLNLDVLDAAMKEYVAVFDGLLDFRFQNVVKTQIAWPRAKIRAAHAQGLLDDHYAQFPRACALLSFLDNHDQQRFLFEARGRRERLLAAARLQFAQAQPPVIYYGTEIGMSQDGPFAGDFGDLKCRRMMRWEERDVELLSEYQSLIAQWKRRAEER